MAVSSHDVKAVVRDQCFFMDFEGDAEYQKITYSLIHSSIYGEHDSASLYITPFVSCICSNKHQQFIFPVLTA